MANEQSKNQGISWILFGAPMAFMGREYKAVLAVLVALVVAVAIGQLGNAVFHGEDLAENAFPIEGVEVAQGGTDGGTEAPAIEAIGPHLAAADAAAGEAAAGKCAGCHTFEDGGPGRVGPNLYGVVGRDIGGVDGFGYSDALAGAEGGWDFETLNAFLVNPSEAMSGTTMGFAGIRSRGERADLIAYLNQNSGAPLPLPEAGAVPVEDAPAELVIEEVEDLPADEAVEETAAAPEDTAGDGLAAMIAAADVAAGEATAAQCMGCHTLDAGGATRVGPNLYGIVGDDIAARGDFGYSESLTGLDGVWSYEAISGFLANPAEFAPGNRMPFGGLQSEQDRINLIAYLRGNDDSPEPLP